MAIKVAYDEQIFLLQNYGGISRYFTELIRQFQLSPELGIEPVILGRRGNSRIASRVLPMHKFHRGTDKIARLWRLTLALVMNRNKSSRYDVCHLTFYLPGFFHRLPNVPKVVTLFDMIPELFPAAIRNPHFQKREYLKRADAIVSISKSSVKDMRNVYGFDLPVTTTYLGVSELFRPGLEPLKGVPEQYLLFVGGRKGYKNWKLAMEAFSAFAETHAGIHMVLVGARLNGSENNLLRSLGIRDIVHTLEVSDSELALLYSNAKALIYPSTIEGFGLPLIEAMASGTPIVALRTRNNLEVCREVPLYAEELSQESISHAVSLVMTEDSEITIRIQAGIALAKEYSWYNCAQKTAQVYKSVAGERARG
jgi:glycosyltransferase involved in cell wall biosynthesis